MRILLIEDDDGIAANVQAALEHAGFLVEREKDGEIGWFRGDSENFDAVVLDLRMPGGDGWSVLACLKSDPALVSIPVVLLSADSTANERLDCWVPGLLELVEKPFLPATLVEARHRAGDADADVAEHAVRVLAELPGGG